MTKGSGQPRASWRKSTRAVAPNALPNAYGADDFGSRGRSRRRLLFQVSALLTLAVGLSVILASYLLRKPDLDVPFVFAGVSESKLRTTNDPLYAPPNPFAAEDARLLRDWFRERADQHLVFVGNPVEQTGTMAGTTEDQPTLINAVVRQLGKLPPGGPNGDMIAVFVTAHGIVDDQNDEPYLIVGDSSSDDVATWVSLSELLSGIKSKLETKDSRLRDARVLLFLDACRGGSIWDWGKLDQSFTDRCREVAARVAPERIAVIASCGDGQRSWWDPRRGQSLFGRAIVEALTGRADLDGNDMITVEEIAKYVSDQVATDARAIWSADQLPELLTASAAEWKVIRRPDAVAPPASIDFDIERVRKSLARINGLWHRHNGVAKMPHPPLVTQPLAWSVLEKHLARLDQLALAGTSYQGEFDMHSAACETLVTQLESGAPGLPTRSVLPELRLSEYFHGPAKLGETENEFAKAWQKDPVPDKVPVPPGLDEQQVMEILWPWLAEKNFDAQSMATIGVLLDPLASRNGTPVRLLETQLIRLSTSPDLTSAVIGRAGSIISAHRASRDALLTPDLRASFWIRQQLASLDTQRMMLSDTALARGSSEGAQERLNRLVENEYAGLKRDGTRISDAYRLRDRMLHEVPRLTETLLADVGAFADEERDQNSTQLIRAATDAVRCLDAALRLTKADDPPRETQQFRDASRSAELALGRLRQRVDQRVSAVSVRVAGDESGLRKTFALLQGSGVNDAGGRAQLHDRLLNLLAQDAGESQSKGESHLNVSPNDIDAWLTMNGKHPWTYWLNETAVLSCGQADVPVKSEGAPNNEGTVSTPSGSLIEQGSLIRRWTGELRLADDSETHQRPDLLSHEGRPLAIVRQDVDELETKYRSRTILLTNRPANVERALDDRFKLDLQLFSMDHARRTVHEFWCEARRGESPFFPSAAKRLLSVQTFSPNVRQMDGRNMDDYLAQAISVANDQETLVARPDGDFSQGVLLDSVGSRAVPFVIDRPGVVPDGGLSIWTSNQSPLLMMERDQMRLTTSLNLPPGITKSDDKFPVTTFFRGLRRTGGLDIKHLDNGRTTLFRLEPYVRPTAVVESDAEASEKVVIVFDCSLSMKGGRLTDAQNALVAYLKVLQKRQSSAGLVLFGHRYYWELDNQGFLIPDPNAQGTKYKTIAVRDGKILRMRSLGLQEVADHHPDFDVEVAVDLQKLDGQHLNRMIKEVFGTTAFGATPTYQAIDKAYDVLGGNSGHIVVLTDGIPELTKNRPQALRNIAMQKFQQRKKDVRLSIVNFDNPKKQVALLNDFPGTVVDARDGRELSEKLQNTLEATIVSWKDERGSISPEVDLDTIVSPDRWPPPDANVAEGQPVRPAVTYLIEAVKRSTSQRAVGTVQVEGGEAFRMFVRDNQLRHRAYPREDHIVEDLRVDGPDAGKFSVVALSPDRNDNRELTLRLVLESREAGDFTVRPNDVWIDLVGTDADDRRRIEYAISLAEFEPGQAVPVILARVKDWPDWAIRLQIDCSIRFGDNAAPRVPLPLSSGRGITLKPVEGFKFAVDQNKTNGHQVKITESFASDTSTDRLRIIPQPLPNEGSVTLYRDNGIVIHEFRYNEPQDSPQAFVTKRSQILDGASIRARTRQPIAIRIDGR